MSANAMSADPSAEVMLEAFQALGQYPDENLGPLVQRLVWALLAVSSVVMAMRFYVKLRETRRVYVDDWLMLLALVMGIGQGVVMSVAISYGFGRHITHLDLDQIQNTMKWGAFNLLFGIFSPMAGRIAFCCTLLFLTRTDPRTKTWPLYLFMAIQMAVNVTGIIVFYVQCGSHMSVFWDVAKQVHYGKYCWEPEVQTYYGYFMGSVNTVTDAYLAILPAVLIEHTRLSRKSKVGLVLLLSLSVLAMAASIVKTYEAKVLSEVNDFTYNLCSYVIWMSVELNVVIITASVALLRPLFRLKKHADVVEPPNPSWHSQAVPLSSVDSLAKSRTRYCTPNHSSMTSVELVPPRDQGEISVTREVRISYEAQDAPFIHAALVGLIQGEIQNPALARI